MLEWFEWRRHVPYLPSSLSTFLPFGFSPFPSPPSPRFRRCVPMTMLPSGTRDEPVWWPAPRSGRHGARLYGALAGTKLLSGTVPSVTHQVKNGRSITGVTATWHLASGTLKNHLMPMKVKRGGAPSVDHSAVDPASPAYVRATVVSVSQGSVALPPARATSSQPSSIPLTDHSPPASLAQEPVPTLCAGAPPVGEVRAHFFMWSSKAVTLPIEGSVPRRSWSVRLLSGETIVEEGDPAGPSTTFWPCSCKSSRVEWLAWHLESVRTAGVTPPPRKRSVWWLGCLSWEPVTSLALVRTYGPQCRATSTSRLLALAS